MTSDESDNSQQKPDGFPQEDWGDAWSDDPPKGRPNASPDSVEKAGDAPQKAQDESQIPEGIDDFKAARPRQPIKGFKASGKAAQPEVQVPVPKKVERKEVPMEARSGDRMGIEDREWSDPTVFSPKWTASITIFILAVVIGSLVLTQQSGPTTKGGGKVTAKEKQKKLIEALEVEIGKLNDRDKEARKMYAAFASAQVVEDVLPMIRDRGQLSDLVRNTAHQTRVGKDWRPPDNSKWSMNLARTRPYATLKGDLPDFTTFTAYYVLEGELLLMDWKATTAFSSSSYEELSQGEGDGSEVRGYLKPANFYTIDFPEDEYHCYKIVSPDKRQVLWAYVKRSSDLARLLGRFYLKGQILEEGSRELPMTLELSRPLGKSLPNQWVIESLLHEEWIQL